MKVMAGMDLHRNNVVCALIDETGRRLGQKRLPNQLGTITSWLEPWRDRMEQIVVESTFNWYWLVDGLQAAHWPVVLANPAKIVQYEGIKHADDQHDAFFLAELSRLKVLPTGHIYDRKLRPVRDMLRRRMLLVEQTTAQKLSLKSLYARTTGGELTLKRLSEVKEEKDLSSLFPNPFDQFVATQQWKTIRQHEQAIEQLEKAVLAVADKLPSHRWLSSVPGVGRILGMVITMETGPVGRFASAGDYASYCRCVQSVRLSNGKAKGRNNGKNGNAYLAWAWVEAAQYARRYYPACGQFYDRKEADVNGTLATKALACKLAKAAWHVMTDQVEFDLKRVFPHWRPPSQVSERGVGSNPEGESQVRAAEAAAAPPPPHRPAPAKDPTSLASLGDVSLRVSPAGQKPKQTRRKKKKAMKKH